MEEYTLAHLHTKWLSPSLVAESIVSSCHYDSVAIDMFVVAFSTPQPTVHRDIITLTIINGWGRVERAVRASNPRPAVHAALYIATAPGPVHT